MKVALVNPAWNYDGSIYFGCREPHLPLELGYSKAMLERDGHRVLMLDGQLQGLGNAELADQVAAFGAKMTVVATAPTYLFWRCAPPELRVPRAFLGRSAAAAAAPSPSGRTARPPRAPPSPSSASTRSCAANARRSSPSWPATGNGAASPRPRSLIDGEPVPTGAVHVSRFADHPAACLAAPMDRRATATITIASMTVRAMVSAPKSRPRAAAPTIAASAPKPTSATPIAAVTISRCLTRSIELIDQGVGYIYFIDEIFLPQKALLEALAERDVVFGVQTRIDLWKPELLELLGEAGCVSIEAGLESLTVEGREMLAKRCRLGTEELAELLIDARRHVPFVQANLIGVVQDDPAFVDYWRDYLIADGVWANEPVPLYPVSEFAELSRAVG